MCSALPVCREHMCVHAPTGARGQRSSLGPCGHGPPTPARGHPAPAPASWGPGQDAWGPMAPPGSLRSRRFRRDRPASWTARQPPTAARCPRRPYTHGPREAFCPNSGAWRGPRPSRSTAPRRRPGRWASGLRTETANLTYPEPLLWAPVTDTQGTLTNTSPLGSTAPSTAQT